MSGNACAICDAPRETFRDLPGRPRVHCPGCGSVERHRAFAIAYQRHFGRSALKGQRVLALRPDHADRRLLRNLGAAEVVVFDAFPRDNPDVVGDPSAVDFPDASFDVVLSNGFLATIPDPAAAVREMRRVLKPDGVALIYESASISAPTREIEDQARRASWYGQEMLDRFGVGLLREWGLADLENRLSETFGLGLMDTSDEETGGRYIWFVGGTNAMLGGPFLDAEDRALLLGAFGSESGKGEPPYACSLCGETFTETVDWDACPACKGHARTRALPAAVERVREVIDPELAERLPLLAFAMVKPERRQLEKLFPRFEKVSLFGGYGDDNTEGVDARDLSRFSDGSFSGVFSIGLYDYFTEHDRALSEAFRVTAPGGVLLMLILPARLRPGMHPPAVEHVIQGRPDYYEYLPEGANFASASVGRGWFLEAMRRAGWEAESFTVTDPATGIVNTWFLGRKPLQAATPARTGWWSALLDRLRGASPVLVPVFAEELAALAPALL